MTIFRPNRKIRENWKDIRKNPRRKSPIFTGIFIALYSKKEAVRKRTRTEQAERKRKIKKGRQTKQMVL